MRRSQEWTDEDGWQNQAPLIDQVLNSADYREGMAAFAEKREPEWTGR